VRFNRLCNTDERIHERIDLLGTQATRQAVFGEVADSFILKGQRNAQ